MIIVMKKKSKILITGSTGMVGKSLIKYLLDEGYLNLLYPTREEVDLLEKEEVSEYFEKYEPEYVFMIAAKVGGIGANLADPVGFLDENTTINNNLFRASHASGVKKILYMGSSCIYPNESSQPIREEYLMTGTLEPTNEAYALGKIHGLKLANYYYLQYGLVTVCPMYPNIYGTGDSFDTEKSHVLSAIVKKFVEAKEEQEEKVMLWGSGNPRREFMNVKDVVESLVYAIQNFNTPDIVNVGTGIDISIKDLAALISVEVGYEGEIYWDQNKPDGMLRKCMDVEKMKELGYNPQVSLRSGIQQTIKEYREIYAKR